MSFQQDEVVLLGVKSKKCWPKGQQSVVESYYYY